MTKAVLFYDPPGVDADIQTHFPAHLERINDFHSRGLLLMVGAFENIWADGSMAVFAHRTAAEEFARGDPYVVHGVVQAWQVKDWKESLVD